MTHHSSATTRRRGSACNKSHLARTSDPFRELANPSDQQDRRAHIQDPQLRRQKGWSQERLAEEADIHRLAGIETARLNPSLRNLIRVATPLGVHPRDLFD